MQQLPVKLHMLATCSAEEQLGCLVCELLHPAHKLAVPTHADNSDAAHGNDGLVGLTAQACWHDEQQT